MRRLAVAAGAVALLAVGGVAFAQTTGDERIYACVNNGDGTMRQVAGPDVACNKSSHKLSWAAEQPVIPVPRRYRRFSDPLFLQPDQTGSRLAACDTAEDLAVGGGFGVNVDPDFKVVGSEPVTTTGDVTGWLVTVYNANDVQGGLTAYVVCLDFTP